MDKERSSVLLELNNMQMNIYSLFEDLIAEKNDYKQNSDNLAKQLEKVSDEVQNLKIEAENLKKEKEVLKRINKEMIDVFYKAIDILKMVNFSNLNFPSEHRNALGSLKKIFLESNERLGHCKTIEINDKGSKQDNVDSNNKRNGLLAKETQKELELNLSTDFYFNEDSQKTPKKDLVLKKTSSDTVFKSLFQNAFEGIKSLKGSSPSAKNETCDSERVNTALSAKSFRPVPPTPEDESQLNRSPVFREFGVRRLDSLSSEENSSKSTTSHKLINEKFLERPSGFVLSPWKSPNRTNQKSPSTPKRVKKQLKLVSPDRSPLSFLKKSNTRDAEISFTGVKKLRQTVLNIDRYKRKSSEEEILDNENKVNNCESKKVVSDLVDDDFINESPKKTDLVLEDVINKRNAHNPNEVVFITPPPNSDSDLDETYVSSSIVRKCNMTKKREREMLVQDQTPTKRLAREKSPEHDSVPFVYRREPIRKKAERMKLPGHACVECNKYYENAFEDINTQELKKILNKCSRHRDKNSPSLDDTPPGYWKPYLTCTNISPSKDDTSKNGY